MKRQPMGSNVESRLRQDPVLGEISRCLGSDQCWVVGGWVRDRALGLNPPDLDLVVRGVDAARQAAVALGAAWKTSPRLLGRPEKAVWRLTGPQRKVEIWPLEHDDLEADALRRDFACNALFWRLPDGPLLDFADGLDDIGRRRLRAISKENLKADPVRLLRGVRLTATLDGFSLEPRTRNWIAALAPSLADAPRERVGAELLTLAQAPGSGEGLRMCTALDLLTPAGPRDHGRACNASLKTLARLTGEERHPTPAALAHNRTEVLLAWLASGWSVDSAKELAPFAWPKEIVRIVASVSGLHQEAGDLVDRNPADRREFMARCGDAFPVVLALAAANDSADLERSSQWRRWWRQWVRSGRVVVGQKPLLTASEVADITGTQPGPRLGRMVRDLERATVRREVRTPCGARRWLEARKD